MKSMRFFLFIFTLFLSTNLFPQLLKPGAQGVNILSNGTGSLSINVGPSIPISDFSKNDVTNVASGYAKLGYMAEGNVSIRITPILSIGIMSFFNTNPTNIQPVIDYLKTDYPAYSWSGNSNSWKMFGFLGGFSFSYPAAPKITTELKALAGWLGAKSPLISVSSASGSDLSTFKIEEKNIDTWSYLLAMNIRYATSSNVSVFFNIEFLGSNPSFRNVNTSLNINGTTVKSNTASFNRKIDALILGVGLRYAL